MNAIPEMADPSRYTKANFIESKFVEIVSGDLFDVKMQYPILKMKAAEENCFLRRETYEHLVEAAKKLPQGFKFRIFDAWRPFALQHELYVKYSFDIIKRFNLELCTPEQQNTVIRKFVSPPIEDRNVPPVHTTGGAVDLTIINSAGEELDMGSGFDEFTDRTYTSYYENEKNDRVKENRRLLFHTMIEAGFVNLPSEWWHFDYGDRFWAYYKRKPALYKGIFTKKELSV